VQRIRRAALPAVGAMIVIMGCQQNSQPPVPPAQTIAAPSRSDVLLDAAARIALPPPGLAAVDLPDPNSHGAQLEAKYCAQCHALPAPGAHSATDWPIVTRRMWLRMEWLPESLGVLVPSDAERFEILKYLIANALKVSGSVLPPGPGREAFAAVCSRCHALPDLRNHSKADWAIVFARMERNMERMKVAPPTGQQAHEILDYLQATAGAHRAGARPASD
jgi:cytochrome c5